LVDVGSDAAGRRQRKKVSGRSRAEVLLKMPEVQRDAEDGLASGGRHLTVAALAEEWLRHRSGELSASTLEVRTWAVRQHLVPALGARRVRQLSAEDVSLFLQDLVVAGYARGQPGQGSRRPRPGPPARRAAGPGRPQRRRTRPDTG